MRSGNTENNELKLELGRESKIVPKKLHQINQTKPFQLSLFELLTETDVLTEGGSRQVSKGRNYSQTIELYDFMPRFVYSHQADVRRNYNGLLPPLVRDFESRGAKFRLTLAPAAFVRKTGESISFYPGSDEDIVEMVLRKIYLEGDTKLFDGQPGMVFTINQIRREMKEQGHTRSHRQVLESLLILKGSQINCQNLETGTNLVFNPIDVLSYNEKNSGDEPCYLIFSRLVAEALNRMYFRRYNYRQVVRYKSNVARLLHRRISHHFTQANEEISYSVYLSTLLRDFGLEYATLAKAYQHFKKGIGEMKEANVVLDFVAAPVMSQHDKRKIDDYHLEITMTKTFSFEVKNSNVIRQNVGRLSDAMGGEKSSAFSEKKKIPSIFPASLDKKSSKG